MATQPNLCTHDVIVAANFSCNKLNTFKMDSEDGNFMTRTLVNAEQLRISINNADYVKNYQDVAFGRLSCVTKRNYLDIFFRGGQRGIDDYNEDFKEQGVM